MTNWEIGFIIGITLMKNGWKKKQSKYLDINPPYIKKCLMCDVSMEYNNKYTFIYSKKNNRLCGSCARKGENNPMFNKKRPEQSNRMRISNPTKLDNVKEKISKFHKGKIHSKETKRKMSESHKGKIISKKTKQNMRLSAIKRIENKCGQIMPNYNPEGCKIIDDYGMKNGYNFQHALNGGEYHIEELGYFVDGYNKEKNIVIEIDEKYHFNKNGKLKKKDVQRQKEIEKHLKCKFIRIKI